MSKAKFYFKDADALKPNWPNHIGDIFIPEKIKSYLSSQAYYANNMGMSQATVLYFADQVLKIEKEREEADNEHRMLGWLQGKIPVPSIICAEKIDGINYLLMSKAEGCMACEPYYLERCEELVTLLAEGLKLLWSVDIADCPYNNCLENKLQLAKSRVENNLVDMEDAPPDTYGENGFADPRELWEWLMANRPPEDLRLSHGDYCLPNIFLKEGKVNGFIDLGRSGIADKWQDIALCYRSLKSNFAGEYGGKVYKDFDSLLLFEKLELEPDWNKIRYYILLDELF